MTSAMSLKEFLHAMHLATVVVAVAESDDEDGEVCVALSYLDHLAGPGGLQAWAQGVRAQDDLDRRGLVYRMRDRIRERWFLDFAYGAYDDLLVTH
jgi:hypothetical protein